MASDVMYQLKDLNILDLFKVMQSKDLENINILMVIHMREESKMDSIMVKENLFKTNKITMMEVGK
jgi:hypothetical protein